ncbi:hypothetical protein EJ419_04030 [Alloscardovia theropitheci]|uniref:DUF2975 domain-containing protein n=1 Tax=Alloscardovia theropitheci TaxID=2496842 RepID=A0A4R0QXC4_9BIFI|nr:hypothetical protein [Alloscardovia theropitheci]TCD54220.1 hypothetical protein EJ419_04030 [Alloscardovia theropitheci]
MSRKTTYQRALIVFCALFVLLAILGLMLAGLATIEDEFAKEPRYMWIHTPIMCLLALFPIPVTVWTVLTTYHFSFGYTKLSTERLLTYLRVSFWLAIAQAIIGFSIPFTVSTFLGEGNPPMLIAWVTVTMVPFFIACFIALLKQKIIDVMKES